MEKYYRHVKGTIDLYPPKSRLFQDIIAKAKELFRIFGYEEIILPILEEEEVFKKGVGEGTEIVEKQMFKIEDKNIVLRPEGTAQIVRFYIEKNLHKQRDFHKFFYIGAMFRGERPQKGRLRQFHHIGCEFFGSSSPYVDLEIIKLATLILATCGIERVLLKINSLGCEEDKKRLINLLKKELASYQDRLCSLCNSRIETNPLRILDCKEESCQKVASSLNLGKNLLCSSCRQHFDTVLSLLDDFGISYTYQPYLVRGLDYYTHTIFELISPQLGAQDACGAGGRYNNLVRRLGGGDIPAMGFALGLERIMLLLKAPPPPLNPRVFVAYTGAQLYREAFKLLSSLRDKGILSDIDYKDRSLKAQLRLAEKLGADWVVIVGEQELVDGCIILRDMKASTQEKVELEKIISILQEKIKS
jgi:histidyl-tRNA synthetase